MGCSNLRLQMQVETRPSCTCKDYCCAKKTPWDYRLPMQVSKYQGNRSKRWNMHKIRWNSTCKLTIFLAWLYFAYQMFVPVLSEWRFCHGSVHAYREAWLSRPRQLTQWPSIPGNLRWGPPYKEYLNTPELPSCPSAASPEPALLYLQSVPQPGHAFIDFSCWVVLGRSWKIQTQHLLPHATLQLDFVLRSWCLIGRIGQKTSTTSRRLAPHGSRSSESWKGFGCMLFKPQDKLHHGQDPVGISP